MESEPLCKWMIRSDKDGCEKERDREIGIDTRQIQTDRQTERRREKRYRSLCTKIQISVIMEPAAVVASIILTSSSLCFLELTCMLFFDWAGVRWRLGRGWSDTSR